MHQCTDEHFKYIGITYYDIDLRYVCHNDHLGGIQETSIFFIIYHIKTKNYHSKRLKDDIFHVLQRKKI